METNVNYFRQTFAEQASTVTCRGSPFSRQSQQEGIGKTHPNTNNSGTALKLIVRTWQELERIFSTFAIHRPIVPLPSSHPYETRIHTRSLR